MAQRPNAADPGPWEVDAQQRWAKHDSSGEGWDWYSIEEDGSLAFLQDPPPEALAASFVPACVVYATKGGPRKEPQQQQASSFFFGTSELHERNHATNRCPSKGPARGSRNLTNVTP